MVRLKREICKRGEGLCRRPFQSMAAQTDADVFYKVFVCIEASARGGACAQALARMHSYSEEHCLSVKVLLGHGILNIFNICLLSVSTLCMLFNAGNLS